MTENSDNLAMIPRPNDLTLVLAISVLGLATVYTLDARDARDSKRAVNELNLAQVGQVESVQGQALVLRAQGFFWQALENGEAIQLGDSVRTLRESQTLLIFSTGASAALLPQTEILLTSNHDKIFSRFIKGSVFFKGEKQRPGISLAVEFQNSNIDLQDANFLMVSEDGLQARLEVDRGTAAAAFQGRSRLLDKDAVAVFAASGISLEKRVLKVKSPKPTDTLFVGEDGGGFTHFTWEPLAPGFKVSLFISAQKSLVPAVDGTLGDIAVKLAPGNYLWRLVAESDDHKTVFTSNVNYSEVVTEMAPLLFRPQELSKKSEIFRWVNPAKLVKLQLEVAKDSAFKNLVLAEEVDDTGFYQSRVLGVGTYHCRLSGFRPGTPLSSTSMAQSFTIK